MAASKCRGILRKYSIKLTLSLLKEKSYCSSNINVFRYCEYKTPIKKYSLTEFCTALYELFIVNVN